MRRPMLALLATLLLPGGSFHSQAAERALIAGRTYVNLASWAAEWGFSPGWTRPRLEYKLGSRWRDLVFVVDSHKTRFNGVLIHLTHPIALRGTSAWISEMDEQSTLFPLLRPARNRASIPMIHVCLDPGHGGRDPGNHALGRYEKKYTLELAAKLRAKLKNAGLKVTQTRQTDSYPGLEERTHLARHLGADLFVSLHFNASPTAQNQIRGVETFALTPPGAASTHAPRSALETRRYPGNRNDEKNILAAYHIHRALVQSLDLEDRGVKRARFQVLREAEMPAVLVEAGFLTHPDEGRKIATPAHLDRLAQAITDGILSYKRLLER